MVIDEVSSIAFYPLKGAHAATVEGEIPLTLPVGVTGFEQFGVRDRDFVLFDPNEGAMVTQRGWGSQGKRVKFPLDRYLANIRVDVRGDHLSFQSDIGQLDLPIEPLEGNPRTIQIFGKEQRVIPQGPEPAQYFSQLFGRELLLMRTDHVNPRVLKDYYQRVGAFNIAAASDGMPFLLTSEASLAQMHQFNRVAPGSIPINRYRGNIMIRGTGIGAFGEDFIDDQVPFYVADIPMWNVKACSRCPVPNVDQESGQMASGGLSVLQGRKGTIFTGETGVFFGQNLVHGGLGRVSVGDQISVGAFNDQPNIAFAELPPQLDGRP